MLAWIGIVVLLEFVNLILLITLHMRHTDLEISLYSLKRKLDATIQDPAEVAKAILDTPIGGRV